MMIRQFPIDVDRLFVCSVCKGDRIPIKDLRKHFYVHGTEPILNPRDALRPTTRILKVNQCNGCTLRTGNNLFKCVHCNKLFCLDCARKHAVEYDSWIRDQRK